jgi:hypothetical protein
LFPDNCFILPGRLLYTLIPKYCGPFWKTVHAMKSDRGVELQLHSFLTSEQAGGKWSTSGPGHFTPGTHWTGGWLNPRSGLDILEKKNFFHLLRIDHQIILTILTTLSQLRLNLRSIAKVLDLV